MRLVRRILIALLRWGGGHLYYGTYCHHDNHGACKLVCKTCSSPCICPCHQEEVVGGV